MAHEINLVPDIKDEMIKTLKLRNYIFFACIVVAAASIGLTLIFGLIAGGQQLALSSKKDTIMSYSAKLKSYSELDDFLTIKDQLGNIATLTSDKKVLSRTFNILSALIPTGADTITISELNVNLSEGAPKYTIEAQANAGKEPFIDYNVLDSFKKSMQYMRYDYGKYVDKEGNEIPSYCITEQGIDGAVFKDPEKGIYAYWDIEGEGCNPSEKLKASDYTTEDYNGENLVRIWRTPQFTDWYSTQEKKNKPYMSLDGEIKNVEHFNSSCITYRGTKSNDNSDIKWDETNDCKLIPDGIEGITILESSNGRNSVNDLVLRFVANITLEPEVYKFENTHMLAIPPAGRRNVTDSYVQVQAMFGERAADCAEDDVDCKTNTKNGGNNG